MLTKNESQKINRNGYRTYKLNRSSQVIVDGGKIMLKSYRTIVAIIDKKNHFHRTWASWSRTTGKHLMSFDKLLDHNDIGEERYINKAHWDTLKAERI